MAENNTNSADNCIPEPQSNNGIPRPPVAWTVPKHPLPGFTWYEPGEKVNPRTGNQVMCTF
ncbi:hypothetical protein [Rhodococcus qingshengii]|uniref:hypothetical protein n=1 Tax=Rhodococcus qingshengii TaxID=334542 RepID=UPI002AFEF01C|nr:hypothetical protein [Rhodococcus qingshengii]MEA1798215.1 hypothetical protein [Rhodococcus qingshengii]